MDTAIFCDDCVPAGGVENLTVGVLRGQCGRCGRGVGSLIGVNYHVGLERHLWPRPIPVGERVPEQIEFGGECDGDSDSVLAFQWNTEQWAEATYNHNSKEWHFFDDWHAASWITHWLPTPPKPPMVLKKDSEITTFELTAIKPAPAPAPLEE